MALAVGPYQRAGGGGQQVYVMKLIIAFILAIGCYASDADQQQRLIASTVQQIQRDSHVVSLMMGSIRNLVIVPATLPGVEMATTEMEGKTITIRVDLEKVDKNREPLANVIIHELTHADDIGRFPETFKRIEAEDRALPWAQRRLEIRAAQRTGAITTYLALQFPDRYSPSITIALQ